MKIHKLLIITFLLIISFVFTQTTTAQINVKGYVKDKAREKANDAVKDGVDDVFEVGKKNKENQQQEEAQTPEESEENVEQPVATEEEQPEAGKPDEKPKLQSYTKYDFVPGDQILLFEDFSQDAIGDFPALWTTNGSGEVRTINGYPGKWLYMSSDENAYCLMKDLVLPENFILEFDVIGEPLPDDYAIRFWISMYNTDADYMIDDLYPGTEGFHITFATDIWEVTGYRNEQNSLSAHSTLDPIKASQLEHVIVWVQKRRLRIYHNGLKILDGPTVLFADAKYNRLRFNQWGGIGHSFISNIKITTASPDTRSKLLTEGKLVSYGIYFDSGKDIVKPESYGSLNDIAKVLTENPTVRINIVGHTDSDGDDAMNLDLSKRRAANVKNSLVKDFGIAADRITTDGKGETQALVPNTSVENKAKNRRVEFIKL